MTDEKRAPVQGFSAGIPWDMHLRAYDAYCKKWSPQEALIEGGCRGGFSTGELDEFIPGWRDELSVRIAQRERITTLQSQCARMREALQLFAAIAKFYADHLDDSKPDNLLLISDCDKKETHITLGMCRRARAALQDEGANND